MHKTENTIALLGGALLGAAAMYVLDPQMGKRRREFIAEQAGEYLDDAGNLVRGGWETVRERAGDIGSRIADKTAEYRDRLGDTAEDYRSRIHDARNSASDAADQLRGQGRHWWNRIVGGSRGAAQDYADRAEDLRENVTDYGNDLWDRVRDIGNRVGSKAGRVTRATRHRVVDDDSSHVLPITLTGVGCCVLGAGLMYVMDPRVGRSRRAWLADKVSSAVRRTGRSFNRTGRDLANRAYGMATETSTRFRPSGPVGSERLLERVRSEMGRVVSHPRLIQVMTDDNGSVTLTGLVLASESERLIATIESMPGVSLVVNRLETRTSEDDLNRAASSMRQNVPQM